MKVKICGITHLEDAVTAKRLGSDMLGFVVQPGMLRYVKPEFLRLVKGEVDIPLVAVKLSTSFEDVIEVADYVQVHKVLTREEIEELTTHSAKFILYVPSSIEGVEYLNLINRTLDALVLIDSAKKGTKVDLSMAKKLLDLRPDAGIGGGVTPENVYEFISLNPGWVDVSSGVESSPAKKDFEKMKRLIRAVKDAS
ncbi:MAG: phosphoribosylanthranilate isomerase [Sulfolobaceae archaeon]|nr:phosphoribosylanthranilate isomerase [Sulfolobales archaeon]